MRSLRARAVVWGMALAVLSVLIGGGILYAGLDRIALDRFDKVLGERQAQLIAALATAGPDAEAIGIFLSDPAYDLPESGRYWQINGDGGVLSSRSLFDTTLAAPANASDAPAFANALGPDGPIRIAAQTVSLESGGEWTVIVGKSLAALSEERIRLRQSLVAAFLLVGLLGLGNALLQTSAVLRPLATLRDEILRRWDGGEDLRPTDYPAEVVPLVSDINRLLQRNRDMFNRTREQGADLAHALKTPAAILRNELAALQAAGTDVRVAKEALDRIDSQILRSLARLRAVNAAAIALPQTQVRASVDRLARLFARLPEASQTEFRIDVGEGDQVAMDHHDLEEVIGNLLENAFRWRNRRVSLSTRRAGEALILTIEDDGPGIADDKRSEALRAGGRLDQQPSGTGLGLTIARDLVQAYGGTLTLDTSEKLGGLRVTLTLPTRAAFGTAGPPQVTAAT